MELPTLTKEQMARLAKLDEEITRKREYEEKNRARKIASAKRTGIPYDLVDTDVVRIGTLLGLVRSLDALEGRAKPGDRFSLLDLFLGDECNGKSRADIPPYFFPSPNRIDEDARADRHRSFISLECSKYSSFVSDMLRQEMTALESHLTITLPNLTTEAFVGVICANATVVLESLEDENDEELWNQLYVLRNALIGPMNICDYKTFVVGQISALTRYGKTRDEILQNLSYVDANLSLYPGFETVRAVPSETYKIQRALIVRSHLKNPELVPFKPSRVIKECCIPALLFVDLGDVLANGIVGPYRNNSLCYANAGYYALKTIDNGVRLWILDDHLTTFSEHLRVDLLAYVSNLLTVVAKGSAADHLVGIGYQLVKPREFRLRVCDIVKTLSRWTPSELDAFDSFPSGRKIPLAASVDVPESIARYVNKK